MFLLNPNEPNEIKMDEVYIALTEDQDGYEGIISMHASNGNVPLVFGNKRLLEPIKKNTKRYDRKNK